MKYFLLSSIVLAFLISVGLSANTLASTAITANTSDVVSQSKLAKLQIPFVKNSGQVSSDVAFYAITSGSTLFITQSGQQVIRLHVPESKSVLAIREKFIAATNTTAVGLDPAKTKINFFKGKDPKSWRENLTSWQKIGIHNVYPGIDYQLRPMSQQAEKIFIVNPEADPKIIRLAIEGIDNLSISSDGSLILHSAAGDLEYSPPVAYQEIDQQRIPVKVSYLVDGKTYGFKVAEYDRKHPLIIDPVVRTSFFGGSSGESGSGIAVNQTTGSVYITGYISSTDLPTTAGVFKENKAETDFQDIYVAKFNATLTTLEAATYYGSNGWEFGAAAIALHPDGSVYLAGKTQGTDLPGAADGYQSSYTGGTYGDAFIARLNEDLTGPPLATYLGGTGEETGISIAVNSYPDHDLYGSVYVAGRTNSTDFPGTTGGFLETNQGNTDVFVAYFDATLKNLGQATYFGGTGWDEPATDTRGQALLIHPYTGDVLLVGWTSSSTIPSLLYGRNGTSDAFYARLYSTLDGAQTGTYIGGNDQDMASAMAMLPLEGSVDVDVFVIGRTKSTTDLVNPAHGGFKTSYQGGNFDAFIVRLSNVVAVNSTYLGGESDDRGYGIMVNPIDERVWVTGETNSSGFPTAGATDQADNSGYIDAFVTALPLNLGSLQYSSYLGGTSGDYGYAMAIHQPSRRLYVVGSTSSSDLHGADSEAYDSSYNEGGDAFVALFEDITPATMWTTSNLGPGYGPDLGVDDAGNLYACYFQGNQMHIKMRNVTNGSWSIYASYDRPDGEGFMDCSIAVQGNGGVHACLVTDPLLDGILENGENNNLWYAFAGADLEAVDLYQNVTHGVDGECAIALEQNRPSISYRAVGYNEYGSHFLALAVKPAPGEAWIVMNDLLETVFGGTYWSPDPDYGKHTALAFDSTGLPVVAFSDEDGTASFFVPDDYPPLVATALPKWTRYTTSLNANALHLNWDSAGGVLGYESFNLHHKNVSAVESVDIYLKSGATVDDFVVASKSDIPEFSSSAVSGSASPEHLVVSHDSQARYIEIERTHISLTPHFPPDSFVNLNNIFPHHTEVIGDGLNNCALTRHSSGISHALCEDTTGNLIYARQTPPEAGFLSVSPLQWTFGKLSWTSQGAAAEDMKEWRAFYLNNLGNNPLLIRDIRIQSADPAPWALDLGCNLSLPVDLSSDFALAPGQTTAVCVRLDPAAYRGDQITAQLVVKTYHQTVVSELVAGSPAYPSDAKAMPWIPLLLLDD